LGHAEHEDHKTHRRPPGSVKTTPMTMIQALRSAMDVMLARRQRGGLRPGRGLLRRRVPLHRRPAGQVRQVARVRRADLRRRHRRRRRGHGRLRPAPGGRRSSSPTTSTRRRTRSSPRRRGCATARRATSPRR
jgi:hypothetical protein